MAQVRIASSWASTTSDVYRAAVGSIHTGRPSDPRRIVSPGGHVLVLDLRQHEQEWVTDRLGDRWHGFSEEALEKLLAGAGLKDVKVTVGARRPGDPFTVLIASGRKPAEKTQKTR